MDEYVVISGNINGFVYLVIVGGGRGIERRVGGRGIERRVGGRGIERRVGGRGIYNIL
jgi:hypothetical protein